MKGTVYIAYKTQIKRLELQVQKFIQKVSPYKNIQWIWY